MRRALVIGAVVAAVVVAIVLLASGSSSSSGYTVRAYFDSGGFMVSGEQVRVAGANVGTIESVDVSMPGEINSYENGRWASVPGKAVIVMNIEDPGFQDFRRDATCLIRPQSLIGEKYVDCRPTLPRAPGSQQPPPLRRVAEGKPGAGEYILPFQNNSTSVDPDLINNIQTLPYAQRFRLIVNELGATFAGRGSDLQEVIKRANPVLRDTDRLLGTLNAQRDRLAQLASDSEQILRPLSRDRAHVAGFLSNSGAAAQASAERGAELEASLRKFPQFLREFRLTMHSLQGFSDAATPVFADLGKAAPSLTDATKTLTPFSEASTVALKSLGESGAEAGPLLRQAEPIVRKTGELARTGVSPTGELARLLVNIEKTKGWNYLVDTIYNTTATVNAFDQDGHFARTAVQLSNCTDYQLAPQAGGGCTAKFTGPLAPEEGAVTSSLSQIESELLARIAQFEAGQSGGTAAEEPAGPGEGQVGSASSVESPGAAGGEPKASGSATGGTEPLLNYLLGP
jgi:ABC-type transporter Mla subunit MlaD